MSLHEHVASRLNDKLYEKRKQGALEYVSVKQSTPSSLYEVFLRVSVWLTGSRSLERIIRELITKSDHDKVAAILDQLCEEYAYAVHQPHARNGGLIGLAAAAIALGPVCHLPSSSSTNAGPPFV